MADLRVLLVDDEDLILQVLKQFFRQRKDVCDTAANGTEALRLVEDRIYDLVLSDISMPGMDGLELVRRVKILQPHAVCILMSGLGTRRDIISALKIGVFDFVDKPIPDLATLTMVVDRAAESSKLIRERDSLLENLKHQNAKLEYSLLRLHEAFGQLRRQEEALESDLLKAQHVQRKFLPEKLSRVGAFDFFGYYAPCEQLGGDFFGSIPLSNNRVALYLVDVAGHGVSAAMVTVIIRELMRARLRADDGLELFGDPNRVLQFLNGALLEENFDPPIFVSMIYAVFDPAEHEVRIASAGHPSPILISAAGEQKTLLESGLILGAHQTGDYPTLSIVLEPGESLIFYSDGLTEARSGEGQEFSLERLRQLVTAHRGELATTMGEAIETELMRHITGVAANDDVTFLVAHRAAQAVPESEDIAASGAAATQTVKISMPEKLRHVRVETRGHAEGGWQEQQCIIRLHGLITWQIAPALREMIKQGKERSQLPIHLDLAECEGMDSTVLGLLLQNAADLTLHQPGSRVVGQLHDMGVLPLFTISHEPCRRPETMMTVTPNDSPQACSDLILSAHEALMEASADNQKKFKEVVSTLRAKNDDKK